MWMPLLLLLLLQAVVGAHASKSPPRALLDVEFPTNEAGSPSITLGGKLWSRSAPILLGHGCPVHPTAGMVSNRGEGVDQWGSYTYIKTQYSGSCVGHSAIALEVQVQVYSQRPAAVFSTRFPAGITGM